ncbi:Chitin synthase, class 3 [Arthrobotrys musiformis]|uniref:chitin synthase n=1 Tax=Arthrobotrys musiformis TaxID=47236 RepID=A0AAV9WBX2_9PEZI
MSGPHRGSRPVDMTPTSPQTRERRRTSGGQRRREDDDSGYVAETTRSPPRRPTYHSQASASARAPLNPAGAADLSRKKSLIKPERNRITRDNPLYNYHKHAQHMDVLPSTTGIDPETADINSLPGSTARPAPGQARHRLDTMDEEASPLSSKSGAPRQPNKLSRRQTEKAEKYPEMKAAEKRKRQQEVQPLSLWTVYCHVITFWCPNALLRLFGKTKKEPQRAWREKIGLISIILYFCAAVGFLTFGFTQTVCGTPGVRLKANQVDRGLMIIHGVAYNLVGSHHPAAVGIPPGANVLFDLPQKWGGYDASFLFQNVNGQCKGLITLAEGSDVPTNSNGDLAWYFPCNLFKQDGSSPANYSSGAYLGYACHTSDTARKAYYGLDAAGEVYFSWDDLKNDTRKLLVYSGSVLDLGLLEWFNTSQVAWDPIFDQIKNDASLLGKDVTHRFQGPHKRTAQCMAEILRVGSIDVETVGCIASQVVLYVSLIFIVSIVLIKFFLALFFGWFLSWKLSAVRSASKEDKKKRQEEIEAWSNDPQRPAQFPEKPKRASFLPATSRFTQGAGPTKGKPNPTTMGSQSSSRALLPPNAVYGNTTGSRSSMLGSNLDVSRLSGHFNDRHSAIFSEPTSSYIHESVVPQPPPEFQPWGFPLVHTICLVTAYSEGAGGLRATFDSIATTEYPNSHKVILVVCDGIVTGAGEDAPTPDLCLEMMKDFVTPPKQVEAFSYVAIAVGRKRHNMAKVYAGFYDYGQDSKVPKESQQRVPMLLVVKCGTESEQGEKKPGNRGKRDSQIVLMSFLQRVMFDERMTELEYEMFSGLWSITGISPQYYEIVLMVDADTVVFPDSLTHMTAAMVRDPEIMGLCGETKIANKTDSWVSMIQVFEYFISHHLTKAFESVFGGVTCLPGCFCMYRIKAPKGAQNYWVPILANPDVVEHYSENVVDTLHKKNLLLLGEDRYLTTLMLKTFPKRKQIFVPQAVCKTIVPNKFMVLLSQRRRWINSTVHNLMELVLVRDLCGTFCFSMQFVVFIELIGTVVLPAAISFTVYLIVISIVSRPVPVIPLILLGLILGLPAILIVLTAHKWVYVLWMLCYLCSLPIWNFVLPVYAFWKFDDFSWGETRKVSGDKGGAHDEEDGEFDSDKIVMKRWRDFEKDKALRVATARDTGSLAGWSNQSSSQDSTHQWGPPQLQTPYFEAEY